MASKFFEVRDEGTFIPVVAIRTSPHDYLARRAGFSGIVEQTIVIRLTDLKAGYNGDHGQFTGRTMNVAIDYIHEHWDELNTDEVIDVQFIVGQTDVKKRSERYGS